MKNRSLKKLSLKKGTISSLESVNGGRKEPLERAASAHNTTCMSLSGCDTK